MKLQPVINLFRERLVKSIIFSIASSIVVIYLLLTSNIFDTFELKTLDYKFSLRGTKPVASDIAVVFIGNQDIQDIGIWPWRRYYHALLIDTLKKNGIAQIGFDILFTDHSKKEFKDDDFALAYSTKEAGNVNYISFFGYFEDEAFSEEERDVVVDTAPLPPSLARYSFELPKGKEKLFRTATKHTLPIPGILGAAQGIGYADCLPDDDGVTRNLPMLVNYNNRLYMSFTLILVTNYLGVAKEDITINPGESIILLKGEQEYVIPINKKG